ncbi:hypothetical protein [Gemmatimonas sp.]
MPNNIAPELPVNNDALWWCKIFEFVPNDTTGEIEEQPVIGRTDVKAFLAAAEELSEAVAIDASLELALTNVSGTNVYYGYPQGHLLRDHLLPTFKDLPIFVHFTAGSAGEIDWHEAARTIVRDKRTATNGQRMARPAQPMTPSIPALVVDGHTRAVLRSPALRDARGLPTTAARSCSSSVRMPTPDAPPLHTTLRGTGVNVGDGVYTLALMPRDLWLRLAPVAHELIYQRTTSPEHPPHFQPLRVVWRAAEFPLRVSRSPADGTPPQYPGVGLRRNAGLDRSRRRRAPAAARRRPYRVTRSASTGAASVASGHAGRTPRSVACASATAARGTLTTPRLAGSARMGDR